MKLFRLAEQLGARLVGNDVEVSGVASLKSAAATDLVFVDDPKHLAAAMESISAPHSSRAKAAARGSLPQRYTYDTGS